MLLDFLLTANRESPTQLAVVDGRASLTYRRLTRLAAVMADPQVAARNMVVSAPLDSGGQLEMAGNPVKISGYNDPTTRDAAPALDGDRAAIVAELECEPPLPK